jgi:hypothetical protein
MAADPKYTVSTPEEDLEIVIVSISNEPKYETAAPSFNSLTEFESINKEKSGLMKPKVPPNPFGLCLFSYSENNEGEFIKSIRDL